MVKGKGVAGLILRWGLREYTFHFWKDWVMRIGGCVD